MREYRNVTIAHESDGPHAGWYFWETEYPEEGSCGPYETEEEMMSDRAFLDVVDDEEPEDEPEDDPRWSKSGVSFDRHYARRNYYEDDPRNEEDDRG